jgi:uncharacterized membrane protein YjgN (DUF898 family)
MNELIDKDSPATPLATDPLPAMPQAGPLAPAFSGSGAEYFRIWVVNLLLSVATLGIYSAWAKTRRLQYFYRNTQLAGASFDFRGNPKAILRGRLLAVALVAAYHYAFGFSRTTGLVVVGVLLLGLPFMMRSALRFRLSNTWYRGLPFGFDGSLAGAYAVYLPPVALVLTPGVLVAMGVDPKLIGGFFLLYLCWPLLHGAMKRYQHRHLMVGDQRADFPLSFGRLALPYLHAFLLGLAALVVFIAVVAVTAGIGKKGGTIGSVTLVVAIVLLYLSFLLLGPFVLVRMNNRAWSATAFPGIRIDSQMTVRGYLKLQVVNVLLTLLTLGLFRPFAAVRTWRYRLAHVKIDAPDGFEQATRNVQRRPDNAAGDGVADFLGVDLSW